MTKKESKSMRRLNVIGGFVALLFALAAVLLGFFLSGVDQTAYIGGYSKGPYSMPGIILAFGSSKAVESGTEAPAWSAFQGVKYSVDSGMTTYTTPAHTGVMIGYILLMVGFVLALLAMLGKKHKLGSLCLLLGGLCLIAGGVMAFFPIQMAGYENAILTVAGTKSGTEYSLGIGSILTAVCGLVGGVAGTGLGAVALIK